MNNNWKSLLEEFNGKYAPLQTKKILLQKKRCIAVCSSCSQTKSGKESAVPKEFYTSKRLLRFYRWCEQNQLFYGIVSDKHGISWEDEKLAWYDIHPSELTGEDFKRLGKTIQQKCKARKITTLIFFNPSPLMSRPYFKMLCYSHVPFFYCTKLFPLQKGFFG